MPFYRNAYYPFPHEVQGITWSGGMPSSTDVPPGRPLPASGATTLMASLNTPAFKFRPRKESVDWRKISAIDVDKVAGELDFITLQDNIMNITFCNVENERCPYCQNPVDPVLLKLFRLSQLTTEYLLHSQEYLTSSLQVLEEKVQASAHEKDQIRKEMGNYSEEVKSLKEECKRRKKIISTQQMLIQAGASNYHKCQFCDKAFMNYSFLQSHIERRHVEEAAVEKKKKGQSDKFQEEINKLKEQLHATQSQLEAERQVHTSRLSQEQEYAKCFEEWKEEEKEKLCGEMEKMKEMFMKELKELAVQNAKLENQLLEVKSSLLLRSNIGTLRDEQTTEMEEERGKHLLDIQSLKDLLHKQEKKWTSRIEILKRDHENEKYQLQTQINLLKSSVTEEQQASSALYRKRIDELCRKVQGQNDMIVSQKEQIKMLFSRPPEKIISRAPEKIISRPPEKIKEQTVVMPTLQPTAPELLRHEPAGSAHILEPIEELSEEDKESAKSIRKVSSSKQLLINALKKNPSLTKELRPVLEQTLVEKLESMGVRSDLRGISRDYLSEALTTVQSQREEKVKKVPDLQKIRTQLIHELSSKVKEKSSSLTMVASNSSTVLKENQNKTSSEGSRLRTVTSRSEVAHQPLHPTSHTRRNIILPQKISRTPPFSSEEESEEEVIRTHQVPNIIQSKPLIAKSSSGALADQSDTDWTEGSEMEEIDPKLLKQPAALTVRDPMKKAVTDKIEKELSSRIIQRKPTGGVNVMQALAKKDTVREQKLVDADEDDWDISSIEDDKPPAAKTKKGPSGRIASKSVEPTTLFSSSAWGSTGKLTKAGLPEGDTTSTLKSSLVTVTDWSDSSDMENL